MSSSENKKTVLYDRHISLGAKMAPFGGYEMPIQYSGILDEHFTTRKQAAIFDTCHMGEFFISGNSSATDLDKILSCPVFSLKTGQCRYGFICNESGGVIDDQIVYKMSDREFFMVVNAATQDADFEWIKARISTKSSLVNLSAETGKIDLQGPNSLKILNRLFNKPVLNLNYYSWSRNVYKTKDVLFSRTGYTGEIGFEIYLDLEHTLSFWDDCLSLGAKPAGLGARDTLRLEMGYPLYGHELNENRNAAESGFSRAIAKGKSFIGSATVLDPSKSSFHLCGILLDGRRTCRNNDDIFDAAGSFVGKVTSGSYSPSLGCAIAMGYIKRNLATIGASVRVKAGKTELNGTIVEMPFYKDATARKDLSQFL